MSAKARAEPGLKAGGNPVFLISHDGGQKPMHLNHLPVAFPRPLTVNWIGSGAVWTGASTIRDAGVASNDFAYYNTISTPVNTVTTEIQF